MGNKNGSRENFSNETKDLLMQQTGSLTIDYIMNHIIFLL